MQGIGVDRMIIVIQDKTEIVNFDNIMNINIYGCKEDGYSISAGFIVGRDDNYRELGLYETEERAKEVLEQITIAYANIKIIKIPAIHIKETLSAKELKRNIVFEMPEK